MVDNILNIKELNIDELNGVISLYPWYGGARKELCRRMSELGEGALSEESYAEAALYVWSRNIIRELFEKSRKKSPAGKKIIGIIQSNLNKPTRPGIVLAGGDFFSQEAYNGIRSKDDDIFSSFAKRAKEEGFDYHEPEDISEFCTETLAEIYLDQKYYEQAKEIYSKLSLRYPEKSVYFASLIEKINKKTI